MSTRPILPECGTEYRRRLVICCRGNISIWTSFMSCTYRMTVNNARGRRDAEIGGLPSSVVLDVE
jgi:hypothetical protein